MGEMASQITSPTIVYSTVYSGADQIKNQSSASLAICAGNSPVIEEFSAQMAGNAENVFIWWRYYDHACPITEDNKAPERFYIYIYLLHIVFSIIYHMHSTSLSLTNEWK